MKAVFISDLHIKKPDDEAAKLYLKFCNHPETKTSEKIYLLGDIFDFLIGDHKLYTEKFDFFFKSILQFLEGGKTVVFMEGNHDFHFEKTIRNYLKKHTTYYKSFEYLKSGELLKVEDKKFFICHGYEVDYYNEYFKRWYNIYTSRSMYILATYILPYFVLNFLGNQAAKNSKKRGKKTFNYQLMKEKYLKGAKVLIEEKSVDGIISGHTHILESHIYEDGSLYFNNGFPKKDKSFILLDNNMIKLVKLD